MVGNLPAPYFKYNKHTQSAHYISASRIKFVDLERSFRHPPPASQASLIAGLFSSSVILTFFRFLSLASESLWVRSLFHFRGSSNNICRSLLNWPLSSWEVRMCIWGKDRMWNRGHLFNWRFAWSFYDYAFWVKGDVIMHISRWSHKLKGRLLYAHPIAISIVYLIPILKGEHRQMEVWENT